MQLRAREPSAAEKSFNEALRLSPQNPEALNGLGLARLQRGRAAEAAQCFDSALKQQPDYRPALLNLAIVSHQYLKDRQLALEKYREYLALKPTPAERRRPGCDRAAARTGTQSAGAACGDECGGSTQPKPPKPPAAAQAACDERGADCQRAATGAGRQRDQAGCDQSAEAGTRGQCAETGRDQCAEASAGRGDGAAGERGGGETARRAGSEAGAGRSDGPGPSPGFASRTFDHHLVGARERRGPESRQARFLPARQPAQSVSQCGENAPRGQLRSGPAAGSPQGEPVKTGTAGAESAAASPPAPPPKGPPGRYAYKSPAQPAPGNRVRGRAFVRPRGAGAAGASVARSDAGLSLGDASRIPASSRRTTISAWSPPKPATCRLP